MIACLLWRTLLRTTAGLPLHLPAVRSPTAHVILQAVVGPWLT